MIPLLSPEATSIYLLVSNSRCCPFSFSFTCLITPRVLQFNTLFSSLSPYDSLQSVLPVPCSSASPKVSNSNRNYNIILSLHERCSRPTDSKWGWNRMVFKSSWNSCKERPRKEQMSNATYSRKFDRPQGSFFDALLNDVRTRGRSKSHCAAGEEI